jgi:enoyl-CoA hydratase/carnithine racemase
LEDLAMTAGLVVSVDGAVGTITLDRPEVRNAISRAMWLGIPGVVAELAGRVRVVVLRGAGGHFAAGADISEFHEVFGSRAASADYAAAMEGAMAALVACPVPVLAAIEGNCVGGAVALTLCCDVCFADAGARFAVTPARLGLAYSFGDTRRLVQRVGAAGAKDLLFSARRLDAAAAFSMGLVHFLCAAGTVAEEVAAYAALVAGNSTATLRVAKDYVARAAIGQTADDADTMKLYLDVLEGPDFAEGRTAFMAKRKPRF